MIRRPPRSTRTDTLFPDTTLFRSRGAIQMQFELSTRELDAAMIATALRPLDPDARVALDVESGHLEVLSTASAAQVLGVLDAMGCVATPLSQGVHISGGSTCCGQCA